MHKTIAGETEAAAGDLDSQKVSMVQTCTTLANYCSMRFRCRDPTVKTWSRHIPLQPTHYAANGSLSIYPKGKKKLNRSLIFDFPIVSPQHWSTLQFLPILWETLYEDAGHFPVLILNEFRIRKISYENTIVHCTHFRSNDAINHSAIKNETSEMGICKGCYTFKAESTKSRVMILKGTPWCNSGLLYDICVQRAGEIKEESRWSRVFSHSLGSPPLFFISSFFSSNEARCAMLGSMM